MTEPGLFDGVLHPAPFSGGLQDGVADDRRPVAVFEGGAERRHVAVVGDGVQQVRDLVHEGVLPADHVPRRPPVLDERMLGLGDQHLGPTLGLGAAVAPIEVELVETLQVEAERRPGAVDLEPHVVLAAERQAGRFERACGTPLELDRGREGVVNVHRRALATRRCTRSAGNL